MPGLRASRLYSKTCSEVAGDATSHNYPLPLTEVLSCVVRLIESCASLWLQETRAAMLVHYEWTRREKNFEQTFFCCRRDCDAKSVNAACKHGAVISQAHCICCWLVQGCVTVGSMAYLLSQVWVISHDFGDITWSLTLRDGFQDLKALGRSFTLWRITFGTQTELACLTYMSKHVVTSAELSQKLITAL